MKIWWMCKWILDNSQKCSIPNGLPVELLFPCCWLLDGGGGGIIPDEPTKLLPLPEGVIGISPRTSTLCFVINPNGPCAPWGCPCNWEEPPANPPAELTPAATAGTPPRALCLRSLCSSPSPCRDPPYDCEYNYKLIIIICIKLTWKPASLDSLMHLRIWACSSQTHSHK